MKNTVLLVIFLIIKNLTLFAQDEPIKYGKIDASAFNEAGCGLESGSDAVMLCDFQKIYFDSYLDEMRLVYERHFRIKIIDEQGFKYGQFSFTYFARDNVEILSSIRAQTLNLKSNGKIEKTKTARKQIIDSTFSNGWKKVTVVFSDVKKNSIIECSYMLITYDFVNIKTWNFQHEIPVCHSEVHFTVPDFFSYCFFINGNEFLIKNDKKSVFQHLSWSYIPKSFINIYVSGAYRYSFHPQANFSADDYTLIMKNLPALSNIPNNDNCRAKVRIHLAWAEQATARVQLPRGVWEQFTHGIYTGVTRNYYTESKFMLDNAIYPAGYVVYTVQKWDKFSSKLLKDENYGLRLAKFWQYLPILKQLPENIPDSLSRMVWLYDYVKKNVKWNKQYQYYSERDFDEIIKTKSGTSGEINLLLTSLLQKAGYHANPVIVSTQSNGTLNRQLPAYDFFNHAVVNVVVNGSNYFLDATDSLRPYNLLNPDVQGVFGWSVKQKNSDSLIVEQPVVNKRNTLINCQLNSNMNLTGKFETQFFGYKAFEIYKKLHQTQMDTFTNNFFSKSTDFKIDSIKFEPFNEKTLSLKMNGHFSIKNLSSSLDSLAILPYLFQGECDNPLAVQQPKCAYDFEYPQEENYLFNLSINEKDSLVVSPKVMKYSALQNKLRFEQNSSYTGEHLQIKIQMQIKTAHIESNEFYDTFQFFEMSDAVLKQKIVIKRGR